MATTHRGLRKSALKAGYRSGLEQDNAKHLKKHGCGYQYEEQKIMYISKPRTYTPDFVLDNGIVVETKGRFMPSDRAKHLLIKQQYPDLDVRFVFSNSRAKLSKRSKTTYGDWCDKHGFPYADRLIPTDWMNE
jgi:hypothetical protein